MAKNEYFADNPRGQTFPELFVTNLVVTKATGHQMKDQENIFPYTLFLVSFGASDLATRASQS